MKIPVLSYCYLFKFKAVIKLPYLTTLRDLLEMLAETSEPDKTLSVANESQSNFKQ